MNEDMTSNAYGIRMMKDDDNDKNIFEHIS